MAQDRVSLCNQAGLELTEISLPLYPRLVLGLKACAQPSSSIGQNS